MLVRCCKRRVSRWGRRPPRRRGGRLHRHAPGQGRAGRPQRRRQDQPVQGARRRRPSRPPAGWCARAASATCPRTRASSPALDSRTAVTHVLSGRGIDAEHRAHREAAHRHGGARRRAQRRPLQPAPRRTSPPRAATPPRARPGRSPPASACRPTASTCPIGVLSGGERRRVELARILFAGSDVLLPRRADQPPRHRRQGVAARLPAQLPRGAAGDQPRPRAARRGDHPGAPPRPGHRGRRRAPRRVQGHLLAVPSPPAPRTRSAWPSWPPARPRRSPGCRRSSTASAPRPRKAAMAHSMEKRIARLEAERVDSAARGDRVAARPLPRRRRRRVAPCSTPPA